MLTERYGNMNDSGLYSIFTHHVYDIRPLGNAKVFPELVDIVRFIRSAIGNIFSIDAANIGIRMAITKQVKGEYPVIKPIFAEFTLPGAETWAVTIQAHDVTPESLVLTYHNASESSFYRLPGYILRHWQNDEWGEIDVGKTWNETTEEVDFEHQSQPGNGMYIQWDGIGTLPEGQYLIGQEFFT